MGTSNPFRKHLVSGTVDGTAPHSSVSVDLHQTASPAQRPKPAPPAVTPRKRASRIVESSPGATASSLQLARLVDPPVHFDQEVPEVASIIDPDGSLPNPFMQGSDSSAGDRTGRSSPSDLSEPTALAGLQTDRKYTSGDRPRYSLDPEAFKHLMLTGELLAPGNAPSPPRALSAQTTTSQVAINSPEPVSLATEETKAASGYVPKDTTDRGELEVVRRSLDAGSDGQTDATAEGMLGSASVSASPSISRSSSTRARPPPPKPRTRSGGKQSISLSTSLDLSTPPSPPTNRPNTRNEDKPLPRLPPPPPPPPPPTLVVSTPAPTPRTSDQEKKKPPPPPLSRRHSVQVRSSTPVPERGTTSLHHPPPPPPPPPPPVRRTKSAAARNSWSPGNGKSILPPLPPLPLGVSVPRGGGGSDSHRDATLEGHLPVLGEEKEEGTADILVDLEKLQREVDELRGKLAVGV